MILEGFPAVSRCTESGVPGGAAELPAGHRGLCIGRPPSPSCSSFPALLPTPSGCPGHSSFSKTLPYIAGVCVLQLQNHLTTLFSSVFLPFTWCLAPKPQTPRETHTYRNVHTALNPPGTHQEGECGQSHLPEVFPHSFRQWRSAV